MSGLSGINPLTKPDSDHIQTLQEDKETSSELVLETANPVRIRIPSVDIDTKVSEELGLDEAGAIEVPTGYDNVGWYKYGPTPGELGPAVIIGHVDSYQGPAIFYSLGQLEIGDEIFIEREDGSTAVFQVHEYERPLQSDFPTRKVYGDIDHAGLRLITCTGTYDHGIQRYSHNLIVYAKLIRVEESQT